VCVDFVIFRRVDLQLLSLLRSCSFHPPEGSEKLPTGGFFHFICIARSPFEHFSRPQLRVHHDAAGGDECTASHTIKEKSGVKWSHLCSAHDTPDMRVAYSVNTIAAGTCFHCKLAFLSFDCARSAPFCYFGPTAEDADSNFQDKI
jgi:hypothetical protein